MRLHFETSHKFTFRATPESGKGLEASAFVQPHVTIHCPELWEWLKEKLNIEQSDEDDNEEVTHGHPTRPANLAGSP